MSLFAALFRKKAPEIDPETFTDLQNRVKKLSKEIKELRSERKKYALDMENLYDKAQGAVARLRERTKAAKKKQEEGSTEPLEEHDGMQELRERIAARGGRR